MRACRSTNNGVHCWREAGHLGLCSSVLGGRWRKRGSRRRFYDKCKYPPSRGTVALMGGR